MTGCSSSAAYPLCIVHAQSLLCPDFTCIVWVLHAFTVCQFQELTCAQSHVQGDHVILTQL